jgi:hypothetical protein
MSDIVIGEKRYHHLRRGFSVSRSTGLTGEMRSLAGAEMPHKLALTRKKYIDLSAWINVKR